MNRLVNRDKGKGKQMDEQEQRVFAAIADPTRRLLIEKLSAEGSKTATEFADELPITRQGITKHLKILEEANLVTMKQEGRERRYTLSPQPLAEAVFWVTAVTEQWQRRLKSLFDYLAAEEGSASATDEGE
jgi:DNA-binding transcriptional ArsR family regulator